MPISFYCQVKSGAFLFTKCTLGFVLLATVTLQASVGPSSPHFLPQSAAASLGDVETLPGVCLSDSLLDCELILKSYSSP